MSSTQTVTHEKLQPSRTHDYLYGEKFSDFFRKSVTLAIKLINDRKKLRCFQFPVKVSIIPWITLSTNTQTILLHFTLILMFILN